MHFEVGNVGIVLDLDLVFQPFYSGVELGTLHLQRLLVGRGEGKGGL